MRVFVAEDDRTNQLVVRLVLTRLGCTTDIVNDGTAAVASASSSAYDIVLMDMQMPVMGGCEAAAALRRQGYAGPIVALTVSVLAEEQAACLASGMSAVLDRPLDRPSLEALLVRWKPVDRAA